MAEFEKYSPRKMQLDIAPDAIYPGSGDRAFLPGDSLDVVNGRYLDSNGKRFRLRNVPGSVLKTLPLGEGINKVIGSFEYFKESTVLCLVWNSMDIHRIIEYNPVTDLSYVLMQGSSLPFDEDFLITQGGTIDDLFIFNDRNNRMFKISIPRARAGLYVAPYNPFAISFASKPPLDPPVGQMVNDVVALISKVSDDTFQFTHRYIYFNNEYSTFGPLSKVVWPGLDISPSQTTQRAIQVSVPFSLTGIVSKIEFAFRTGNNGPYTIFQTVNNPVGPTVTVLFRNNEDQTVVASEDESRLADNVPDKTQAAAIMDSRIFAVANEEGFTENTGVELSATLGTERTDLPENVNHRYAKEGGIYALGIIYEEDYGKTSFVESSIIINIPYEFQKINEVVPIGGGQFYTLQHPVRKYINWVLNGTPPPYAKKYQIVLSHDRFYANYFQCKVIPHLYVRDMIEGETEGTQTSDAYFWQGKMFRKMGSIVNSTSILYKYVYLQIPVNVPFVPDTTCMIRFSTNSWPVNVKRIVPIIAVVGGFIVIDLKYTDDTLVDPIRQGVDFFFPWQIFDPTTAEIFIPNATPDQRFYEIGESFDVVDGQFSVQFGKIYGDVFNFQENRIPYEYTPLVISGGDYDEGVEDPTRQTVYESPSGILSTTVIQLALPVYTYARGRASIATVPAEKISLLTGFISESLGSGTGGGDTTGQQKLVLTQVKTLDYVKAASDWGRPRIKKPGAKRKDFFNTVLFGEQYIQDTDVNGLPEFRAANRFTIAVERSPIRALAPAGNVLLAIHERNVTSLYLGKGILKQGQEFIQVENDKVIGDEYKLDQRYGTINPESVRQIEDNVYWWDGLRGAVIRYTKAGLFPISFYGMEEYFQKKAQQYRPYQDQVKIITAYDEENKEFLITFPTIDGFIEGVTWAFHVRAEVWSQRYSYVAEMLLGTSINLYGFKDGQLWIMNRNSEHNVFFGIKYDREWEFACNPYPGKNKRYLNIHIDGELTGDITKEAIIARLFTKEGQESYIRAYDFEREEVSMGKWCAAILKDINTPAQAGQVALQSGDEMMSNYLIVRIINDRTDESPCSEVNVVYIEEKFSI
jgi:hypothetical protein